MMGKNLMNYGPATQNGMSVQTTHESFEDLGAVRQTFIALQLRIFCFHNFSPRKDIEYLCCRAKNHQIFTVLSIVCKIKQKRSGENQAGWR